MNRRRFLRSASALAASPLYAASAVALMPPPVSAQAATQREPRSFPSTFVWGTATASYQVEGAVREDGRGASIWDTFTHQPGNVVHNDTGDVADDFYHRYREDVARMKDLGARGFRFSIAWSRIFPQGTGTPNQKGMDFYKRLVDDLRAHDIEPFCTLYHWDLPQALQDRYEGWRGRETAHAFAQYAGYVAGQMQDRIRYWMTINEFPSFIESGYGTKPHNAPKLQSTKKQLAQTSHNAILAHGLAVQAIRAAASGAKVGLAQNTNGVIPAIENEANIAVAKKALRHLNGSYDVPILEGRYSDEYLKALGADAPTFTQEEMKIIGQPLDFYGVNIYSASEVLAADNEDGFIVLPHPASYPKLTADWLYDNPQALYWTPRLMHELWGIQSLYVTENGCAAEDHMTADGHVYDTDRVNLLRNYLAQLQRATADGVPVHGYFLWSLLDNFEWTKGYSQRFGIVYVDYATQKRTPKLSYDFYREVIARNALA